jgi:hypothetical protein
MEIIRRIMPAVKKRILNNTRGSTERNPNFPAIDAEAHKMEKERPVRMVFIRKFKS